MAQNLFGNIFKHTFLALVVFDLLSLLSHLAPNLEPALFFIILILALAAALTKLEYGLYLILAELFVGGKGHLFDLDFNGTTISIRIGLFLVVILAWLIQAVYYRRKLLPLKILKPFYWLLVAILIGLGQGFYRQELSQLFFDSNAWLYFGLVPIFFSVIKNQKIVESWLQILIAGTSFLALKTIGVLMLFAYNSAGIGGFFYHWIRSSGVGEITYVSGTIFRIFLQSQIYLLVAGLIVLTLLAAAKNLDKKNLLKIFGYLYLVSFALLISQSRSYWVGGLIGLISFIVISGWQLKINLKKLSAITLAIIAVIWSQVFLIQAITLNFDGNLVSRRFANLDQEAAGVSRLNQLQPLTNAILEKPIFGYGFGKELTYVSTDPRIVEKYPGGIYTTYAFEWGYLDIWLKIGLFGLAAYFFLISLVIIKILKNPRPLTLGMLLGLVALLATNMFSPYLNHPLGIGFIILITTISYKQYE